MNTAPKGRHARLRVAVLGAATIWCLDAGIGARTCWALQPLSEFVEQAKTANPANREAAATVRQRNAEVSLSTASLLPSFDARGVFTRNQYDAVISLPGGSGGTSTSITVQPLNQLDASFKLTVPLVDVGAWERRAADAATEAAAVANREAKGIEVEKQVTRAYYQLLGAEALLASAHRTQAVAEKSVVDVRSRHEHGVASELDVQRAIAEVASDAQDVASADYQVVQGRRSLQSLSGLEPAPASGFVDEDLHDEPPLQRFLGPSLEGLPAVASAMKTRIAAEKSARAGQLALAPTLSAAAEERITNAPGFIGHSSYYVLTATASWHFDFGVPATVRRRNALADASRAREEQASLDAADAIFNAWHQVRVNIAKARSARAQLMAATIAMGLAEDRYGSGVATQLDLLQAQRDAFRADVSRIQADTDLAYARAALRLSARLATPQKENR
jgi:outer membrane protein TolC